MTEEKQIVCVCVCVRVCDKNLNHIHIFEVNLWKLYEMFFLVLVDY
jgi:hypothetical protein